MEGNWSVYYEDKPVGSCCISREGLYFRVSCRCNRVAEGICRLIMKCGEKTQDLGVLVPVDGCFGLDRKLAARSIPMGEPSFFVSVPGSRQEGRFVPVRSGEPFEFLSQLPCAHFGRKGKEAGVFLK